MKWRCIVCGGSALCGPLSRVHTQALERFRIPMTVGEIRKMAKAADVVVQCLENEGVEYVFGIPG
ncbi:hypothetical protein, partial [Pseudomonas sp.]|uniref:hypothetical protein n=1 Tax=Pseudomonas sp. TaxID=306 RepID=UPI0028B0B099